MSKVKPVTVKIPEEIIFCDRNDGSKYPKSTNDISLVPILYCFFFFQKGLTNKIYISIEQLTKIVGYLNPTEADKRRVEDGINHLLKTRIIKMIGKTRITSYSELLTFKFLPNNYRNFVKNKLCALITVNEFERLTYDWKTNYRSKAWVDFPLLMYVRFKLAEAFNDKNEEYFYNSFLNIGSELNISNSTIGKSANRLRKMGIIEFNQVLISKPYYCGETMRNNTVTTNKFVDPTDILWDELV